MSDVLFVLFLLVFFIVGIFLIVKTLITIFGQVNFARKVYFLSGYVNHNDITKIQRGNCLLKFEKGKLYILQGDNVIEDNSSDIYNFRIWSYKNGLYLAIKMRTHSEYKFSLVNPDDKNTEIAHSVAYKLFEALARRLKIRLENCGESENDD